MKNFIFSSLMLLVCTQLQAGPLTRWTLHREGQKQNYQVTVPCTVELVVTLTILTIPPELLSRL